MGRVEAEALSPAPAGAPRPPAPRGEVRPLSVAPMMERTDRHFRYFLRLLTRETLLYTEMVHVGAVLRGDRDRWLAFDPFERPLALQLGGEDPGDLAEATRIAEDVGFDEVDLNVGCPSDRVQKGRFGACLMAEPDRVAESVAAMREACSLPITVKHRIGIDDLDRYDDMLAFVDRVAPAGCDRFIVHARKAWLSGLSPKENRDIPPLRHEEVHRLKRERPHLRIETNGGIRTLVEARDHLRAVDGVMIGRAAVDDPWMFADADSEVFGRPDPVDDPTEAVRAYLPYVERETSTGQPAGHLVRPLLGLFRGRPGARHWRRALTEGLRDATAPEVVAAALASAPQPRSTSTAPSTSRTG